MIVSRILIVTALATAPGRPLQAPPPLPSTGLDFSGVDQFWKITDLLVRDQEPSEAQWVALLSTPGYRLVEVNWGPRVRPTLEIAFKPSRRGEFQKLTAGSDDGALILKHLVLAREQRASLTAYRDSLAKGTPIADGVAGAARLLPPGATKNGSPPLVAFALFKDDGYSLPQGVVLDLMNARGSPLVPLLAHEFHHTFIDRLVKPVPSGVRAGPDSMIRQALHDARNEGIADLIDKPHPLSFPNPAMATYAARYNREYDRTPAVLHELDSLLVVIADHPSEGEAYQRIGHLFWSNGHPNGAYIAREIVTTFGIDSLMPGARNPAAFLRTYAAAERKQGRPDPLSAKAWRVIEGVEAKYWH